MLVRLFLSEQLLPYSLTMGQNVGEQKEAFSATSCCTLNDTDLAVCLHSSTNR